MFWYLKWHHLKSVTVTILKSRAAEAFQCTCHKALNYLHNKSFHGTNLHFKNGFRHHDLKYFSYVLYVLHKIYPIFPAYNDANCTGIRYANYQFEFNGKWQKNWQNHCWLHNRVTNTMISLLDFCWKSFLKWWKRKWVVQKSYTFWCQFKCMTALYNRYLLILVSAFQMILSYWLIE